MEFFAFYVAMRLVEELLKRFWNDNLNEYKE